jgi:peptidoglycan/LPS O-acetylase OafA/YrhL
VHTDPNRKQRLGSARDVSNYSDVYRHDIDVLRGVAILAVLIFHAKPSILPLGFLGVDVFFVISGYLITRILTRISRDGHITGIYEFYKRRISRLLPALLTMIVVVCAIGWFTMLPYELRALTRSAAATTFFVSNIYAWKTSNYFGPGPDALPLLHTWSLGIEEQFYLGFPLLVWLTHRIAPKQLVVVLLALTFSSLILAASIANGWPTPAFFLLPGRIWELGFGAIAAAGTLPRPKLPHTRAWIATVGVGLIVGGLTIPVFQTVTPVPTALAPVLGATLLMAYGQARITERFIAFAPLRWLGLISFSLYLWHWPIFSFFRIRYGYVLSLEAISGLVAASIILQVY